MTSTAQSRPVVNAIPTATSAAASRRTSLWPLLIVLGALLIRLVFVLVIDPTPHMAGGDGPWLLAAGHSLLDGTIVEPPPTGPVYLIYDGLVQLLVGDAAPQMLRLLNAFWGAALCGCVYLIGRRYFNQSAAIIAGLALAIDPAFVIEAGNVLTESVFLGLLFGAFALYAVRQESIGWRVYAVVGALLALATLTRAVSLLLPVVLVAHLIYLHRKQAVRPLVGLLIAYTLIMSVWTGYYWFRWHQLVIGAQGLAANVYLGTTNWCGPGCVDAQAGINSTGNNQQQYVQGTLDAIRTDPAGYVRHRIENVLGAELQPYNTVYYPGDSIKAIVGNWWASGHHLSDLAAITQRDNFWPKLILYLFHYIALIGGLIGILIGLRLLGARLPLYGMLAYFLALHSILTAIPRYLFPIEPVWWLFAAFALATLIGRIRTVSLPGALRLVRN
ncbi:MAG: glycosyltransferase family 39 protein [Aggregatilineales bacterium]